MDRVDELQRATLVDQPWQPFRGAVIAERRMIAATLIDTLPTADQKRLRTPPAPPPRPEVSRSEAESPPRTPTNNDPLQQLAEA